MADRRRRAGGGPTTNLAGLRGDDGRGLWRVGNAPEEEEGGALMEAAISVGKRERERDRERGGGARLIPDDMRTVKS